ncbi:MAG: YaiI/YqxD family protein [Halioglobus sp.]|nr:YaiI/YqxD family protein [Halioglobus sp.]
MTVWVDADACPRVIREILCRAAVRVEVPLVFVANHVIQVPASPWIKSLQVAQGFDVADDHIAQQVGKDDLVVTSDIPLAAEVIEKGGHVITSRGERYTKENIRQRLNMRDFMDTMRSSVEVGGGPPALGPRDKQAFANALDRYLARHAR